MSTTALPNSQPVATRRRLHLGATRAAAWGAAALLLANFVVGGVGDVDDHTQGWGVVSEVTAGLSFLALAVAFAASVPVAGWRTVLWWLAPVGLTVSGLSMLAVPVAGGEPPPWLFLLGVLPLLVGTVAVGVLGSRRLWSRWTGAGVALLLPIMFLVPLNSLWMALVCVAVARTAAVRNR